MKRLLKRGGVRTYEFFKLDEAKDAAKQYAKEDGTEYAVIKPMVNDDSYEVIKDDFRDTDEGLESIPAIIWHTTEGK